MTASLFAITWWE